MVRREGPVGAALDDEVTDPAIIGPQPVHEEQDDLVDAKPDEERKPGRDANMPDAQAVLPAPPLQDYEQYQKRHAEARLARA